MRCLPGDNGWCNVATARCQTCPGHASESDLCGQVRRGRLFSYLHERSMETHQKVHWWWQDAGSKLKCT
ncbi:hypothetical protein LINGRAHAP2_LOCUS34807 [Linum grandiflorum]